ncbi:hypothetical protein IQ07DRAFT_204138 [Pyrenochaeta sp. DS3sAY3a]|nr:hypothetical protein IQ07DRAFT_204138 [Pyrenochaeta sp. DS3sAY3a]
MAGLALSLTSPTDGAPHPSLGRLERVQSGSLLTHGGYPECLSEKSFSSTQRQGQGPRTSPSTTLLSIRVPEFHCLLRSAFGQRSLRCRRSLQWISIALPRLDFPPPIVAAWPFLGGVGRIRISRMPITYLCRRLAKKWSIGDLALTCQRSRKPWGEISTSVFWSNNDNEGRSAAAPGNQTLFGPRTMLNLATRDRNTIDSVAGAVITWYSICLA